MFHNETVRDSAGFPAIRRAPTASPIRALVLRCPNLARIEATVDSAWLQ